MDQSAIWKTLMFKNIKPIQFPIYPDKTYHCTLAKTINPLYEQYYHPQKILLEDEAQFYDKVEYLKRIYDAKQWKNKINVLSDYYQYHEQIPRFFIKDIARIMNSYQQQIRDFQYEGVTQKMKNQRHTNTPKKKQCLPVTKMIHNVQLSYVDFQKKEKKNEKNIKVKIMKQNQNYRMYKKNSISNSNGHKNFYKLKGFSINHQQESRENKMQKLGTHKQVQHQILKKQDKFKKNKFCTQKQSIQRKKCRHETQKNHNNEQSVINSTGSKQMSRSKSKCDLHLLQKRLIHCESRQQIKTNNQLVRKTRSSKNLLQFEGIQKKNKGIKTMFSKILFVRNR